MNQSQSLSLAEAPARETHPGRAAQVYGSLALLKSSKATLSKTRHESNSCGAISTEDLRVFIRMVVSWWFIVVVSNHRCNHDMVSQIASWCMASNHRLLETMNHD